jgi:hypothetical protein
MNLELYNGLPYFGKDLSGWGGTHSIFEELISKTNPNIIIEIGTWKGQSALHMANIVRNKNLSCKIYCVDTWLGTNDLPISELLPKNGYSQIYYQFLNNIVHENCQNYIIPCPNTSRIYFTKFEEMDLKADLIYVDGSHLYDDAYSDIQNYSTLLNSNGVIFGDDFYWAPGVGRAVEQYCFDKNKQFEIIDERYWKII